VSPTPSTPSAALADTQQQVWLWKTPEMLAIAVAIVRCMVEHDGPLYSDEVDLSFVRPEDRNLIGNVWLPLARRGVVGKTGEYRNSTNGASKSRIIWRYRLASYPLAREFLRRNRAPLRERQDELFPSGREGGVL
jgi:hypothetical protein